MDKNIAQILSLPDDVADILTGTLYDISIDDGNNNSIKIPDMWTLERFIEAGIIRNIREDEIETIQYPYIAYEHVVFSDELALNLDNIAASYQETKKRSRVIQINDTLSTIDSLYIREKDAWYLFEFKNGDWNVRDIEKKVHETLQLLGDLDRLDKSAVITTNRNKHVIETENLNLKSKLTEKLGFEASSEFYKNNMFLYIVYTTDRVRKAKELLKLCSQRNEYADMDEVFRRYGLFRKEIVMPEMKMGYELVNRLAAYLLKATTRNNYFSVYQNVEDMYVRYKNISKPSCQKYLALLKEVPAFISEIRKFLPEKVRSLFSDNMSAEDFLKSLAVCSIWHIKEENMPECDWDEYKVVEKLLDTMLQEEYSKYVAECKNIVQLFGGLLSEDQNMLRFICSDGFADEVRDLVETDFHEALGRILLIRRMTDQRGCYNLNRQQQEMLIRSILQEEMAETDAVLNIVDNDMERFLRFTALRTYFAKRYTCFWNTQEDDYMHMCRQIYYIAQLYEKKETSGESRQKARTYGCFGTLLSSLEDEGTSADLQKKVEERVARIEQKILAGRSRREIQPLTMAVEGVLGSKYIAVQQLKYSLEGTTFKKVCGCKGEDFLF